MKSLTLLITGGIGSGKSLVSRYMEELGVPVYDSDSRTKALYDGELLSRLETALGARLRTEDGRFDKRELARLIFSDNVNMSKMEQVVYPAVIEDFEAWKNEVSGGSVRGHWQVWRKNCSDGVCIGIDKTCFQRDFRHCPCCEGA